MKRILLGFTALFTLVITQGQTTFQKTYGTINDDYGYSVAKTFDGGYIISAPYNNRYWGIIKTDAQGDTTWIKTYSILTTSLNYQFTTSIIQTSDSNYVLVGALRDSNSFTLKVNHSGNILWVKKSGHGFYPVVYRKVTEDNSRNLIVIGSAEIIQTNLCCGPLINKMDSNGNIISTWRPQITCPGAPGCRFQEIFIDMDGNYLVSGDTPSPTMPVPRLLKIDTAGNVLWNKYYPVITSSVSGISQARDKGYLLVGPNWSDDSTLLFKTNKDGDLQWLKKYKENAIGWQGVSIDTTNDGYLISGNNGNICLMKVDLNYNFLWSKEFGGSSSEICGQMKSTSDGGCIIIGSTKSYGAGGYDVYFIKTDQKGLILRQDEIESKKFAIIIPNPFSTQTTLQTAILLEDATLTIDNFLGQTVKQMKNISGPTVILHRGNLPSGLYFLHITQDNKVIATDKLVITDN